jgi:hypothetical protein
MLLLSRSVLLGLVRERHHVGLGYVCVCVCMCAYAPRILLWNVCVCIGACMLVEQLCMYTYNLRYCSGMYVCVYWCMYACMYACSAVMYVHMHANLLLGIHGDCADMLKVYAHMYMHTYMKVDHVRIC